MPHKQHLKVLERDEEETAAATAKAEARDKLENEDAPPVANGRRSRKRVTNKAGRAPSVCSSLRAACSSSIAINPPHSAGLRLKRAFLVGRRGGPSTPVPSWKVFDNPFTDAIAALAAQEQPPGRRLAVSARRLAATLWELQEVPFSRGGANRIRGIEQEQQQQHHQELQRNKNLGVKRSILNGQCFSPASSLVSQRSRRRSSIQPKFAEGARKQQSREQAASARSQVLRLLERHGIPRTDAILESINEIEVANRGIGSTNTMKGPANEPGYGPTTTTEFLKVLNRIWSLEEQHTSNMSLIAALRNELDHAHRQVQELTLNEKSLRKEVENMKKRVLDEKNLWQEQQQESLLLAVQSVSEELEDERKSKRRLEMLQRRATRDQQEVKRTLGKALQDLERERKARELMEDVCDELAREIGDDKARVEELKRESAKVREEVEEERKMLQMAEIWREERVQMKLMEAKLELEEKNTALDKLRGELEAFLKAKRAGDLKDEGHRLSAGARQEVHRHSMDALIGRNLADSFHPREARVSARNSLDSLRVSESKACARKMQEPDDEDISGDDDDLHSIELNPEPFAKAGSSIWGHHSFQQQDVESRGRRSTGQRVSNVEKLKQRQVGKSQGLERTRSCQMELVGREEARKEKDNHWDYTQDSQWIERSVERGEMREWSRDPQVEGERREENHNSWHSDNEGSQGHISFSPKLLGMAMQGHAESFARVGSENTGPHQQEHLKQEFPLGNAAWHRRTVGSSRDPRANPVFAAVHQLSHGTSSPTRQWNHYWSSPDRGSPCQGRGPRSSSEILQGSSDNSLKAKLLEAKLEGQQARLRANKCL